MFDGRDFIVTDIEEVETSKTLENSFPHRLQLVIRGGERSKIGHVLETAASWYHR
jgi:hypothetical protein